MNGAIGRRTGRAIQERVVVAMTVTVMVSLAVLGVAGPAAAEAPEREEFSVPLSGPHFLSGPCGVPIEQEGTLKGHVTTHPGGLERAHLRVDVTLTGNGKMAREQPSFNATVDPDAGTVTLAGTVVNVHAPGEGELLKDAGRIVRDLLTGDIIEIAGRWDVIEGDFGAVCSYFAAP